MRPWIVRRFPLELVTALLLACDTAPTTPPAEKEEGWEKEQRERREAQRAEALAKLDEAKLAFETEKTFDNFERYCYAVSQFESLERAVREGADVRPHYEALLNGVGKEYLDQLLAEWSNKKARTAELKQTLKSVYDKRIDLLDYGQFPGPTDPAVYMPDGVAMFAIGYPGEDWEIGGPIWISDFGLLEEVEDVGGGEAVRQLCRAALDQAIADDKRDKSRQHYIMQVCVHDQVRWEEDLDAWTDPAQSKEFRKKFGPILAHKVAEDETRKYGGMNVQINLISTCDKAVKLYWGADPSGPGTSSPISANETGTMQVPVGQQLWLVVNKKGISTTAVKRTTKALEITCTRITAV